MIQEAPAREITVGTGEPQDGKLVDLRQELISTREQLRPSSRLRSDQRGADGGTRGGPLGQRGTPSTNEELETPEELQSSNEELSTLNEELQEPERWNWAQLANDLSNLTCRRKHPGSSWWVVIGESAPTAAAGTAAEPDPRRWAGRLSDLQAQHRPLPDLDSLISEVSGNGSPAEREVQGRDGRWYSPSNQDCTRPAENKIDGVLMALMDIVT